MRFNYPNGVEGLKLVTENILWTFSLDKNIHHYHISPSLDICLRNPNLCCLVRWNPCQEDFFLIRWSSDGGKSGTNYWEGFHQSWALPYTVGTKGPDWHLILSVCGP